MRDWYEQHVDGLLALEAAFRDHLGDALRSASLEDARLETRTKALDSFVEKATKSDGRGGFKYADPATELTDFVGARVLVPLSADVAPVARLVQRLYVVEEMSDQRADSMLDVPGYQSLHFLVRFRDEDRDGLGLTERGVPDRPVEVQVRSILQHAWAALQHDLMYKGERAPTDQVRRRLIALAGLLELADQEFMQVRLAHGDAAGTARRLPCGWLRRGRRAGLGRATGRRRGRHRAARLGRRPACGAHRARCDHGRRRRRHCSVSGPAGAPSWRGPRGRRGRGPRRRTSPTWPCVSLSAPTTSPAARSPTRPLPRPSTSSVLRFAKPWRGRRDSDPLRAGRDRHRRPGVASRRPGSQATAHGAGRGCVRRRLRGPADAADRDGLAAHRLADTARSTSSGTSTECSAGTVQSVLLFGVGLLSYEAGQLRAQERLDESVTAAGLGGIVDHLVDAEVGLAFLSSPEPPDAHGWTWAPGKPLEWLRQGRERLHRHAADRTGDPRTWPATLPETTDPEWRKELIDQCIRRLLVALRNWTPLIATSRNGTRVLVAIAELRKDLVELDAHLLDDRHVVEPLLVSLRGPGPVAGVLPRAQERRGPAAARGARHLRTAARDAGVAGMGGGPLGPGPLRRGVDEGPADGDRHAHPARR